MKIENDNDGNVDKNDDFMEIQKEISNDIKEKEKFLDDYCDKVTKEVNNIDAKSTHFDSKMTSTKVFNLQKSELPKPSKRAPLDPIKKTKLLAALKSIESNSFGK